MQNTKTAIVAFGGNLPVGGTLPEFTIKASFAMLYDMGVTLVAQSSLYQTPCFPSGAGPDYVNAVAVIRYASEWAPAKLLAVLHKVEAQFGRVRQTRWGMRTLDIDLIAIGDMVLHDPVTLRHWIDLTPDEQQLAAPDHLILPHPRLQDRAFVLVPLAEILPDWRHPLLDASVLDLLAALPAKDREEVREIPDSGVVKPRHRA